MEVKDLHQKKNPLLGLEHSIHSVSGTQLKRFEKDFHRGTPFPYLLGQAEFYGLSLTVTSDVLIPRPETEQLVELVTKGGKSFERALDVGTGSGAIILSLISQGVVRNAEAVDLSEEALEVAKVNAERLRLPCDFKKSDRLNAVTGTYDLIVSNPPYIKRASHAHLVQKTVAEFEPATALYLLDDVYDDWFKKFFQDIFKHLEPGGSFFMEGHELEVVKQAKVLSQLGFKDVKVLPDYSGLNRFLVSIR